MGEESPKAIDRRTLVLYNDLAVLLLFLRTPFNEPFSMSNKNNRQERLNHTISVVQQRFGPRSLRQGVVTSIDVPYIPTGFASLDEALGIGGIPQGRLSLFQGALTSGKLTLAALLITNAQKTKRRSSAYISLNRACDADYLARCGVDLSHLYVMQPDDSRQALDMALTLADRKELGVVVFDAWGAIEADRESHRLAAAVLDQLASRLIHSGVTFVVLSEVPPAWRRLITPWTDPTHHALSQHAFVQLTLRRQGSLKLGPDVRGYEVQTTIDRNRLGKEGQTITVTIHFNGTVRGDGL